MTKNIEVLLKYYWTLSSTGYPAEKAEVLPPRLRRTRLYSAVRDISLRNIMQDKVEFTSLMAIMAARMVHLSRIPLIGFVRPEYYMQFALSAVRERMVTCQSRGITGDRILLQGIYNLALAEWLAQRFEVSLMHVRAAKLLLPLVNLDSPMDSFIAQGITIVDKLIAAETGELPEFPLMFDPGPLEENRKRLICEELSAFASGRFEPMHYPQSSAPDASKLTDAIISHQVDYLADASTIMDFSLGEGFERALAANIIYPSLAFILRDLLDVLTMAKYVWRTPNATLDDADWMCKRARAICYRLLALRANIPFPEFSMWSAKTEALRIALVLVMLRCTNRMSFRSAQPNMRHLQRTLYGIDTTWDTLDTRSDPIANPVDTSVQVSQTNALPTSVSHSNTASSSVSPGTPSSISHDSSGAPYHENALLLWTLMTGHFASQGEPEELWFLMRAAYVAEHHMKLTGYEDLKEFMGKYLYSKTQQATSLMTVAMHMSS